MWIFSVLFLISVLVLIVGLVLMIQKKTRNRGKQISIIFLVISLVSYGIARIDGTTDNNSSNNVTKKHPIHNNSKNGSTPTDKYITKAQYENINIGMTNKEVQKKLGKVSSGNIIDLDSDKYEWNYSTAGTGLAYFDFDKKTNKLVEKSEIGVLSENSETVTDKNGTRDDSKDNSDSDHTSNTNNDEYADYVQFDIEDAIGSKVDWANGKKINTVKKVEINDNAGKNDGSKLILVYLNAPVKATNNMIKTMVNEDTLKITKALMKDNTSLDFKKDSITYFWYLPLTDKYGKTSSSEAYKISLENATLNKIDYKHLSNVDLPSVADQYNVLYKE